MDTNTGTHENDRTTGTHRITGTFIVVALRLNESNRNVNSDNKYVPPLIVAVVLIFTGEEKDVTLLMLSNGATYKNQINNSIHKYKTHK
jgi:hypothetical protein